MAIFNFYRYEILQADDRESLFAEEEKEEARKITSNYATPQDWVRSFFERIQTYQLQVQKPHTVNGASVLETELYKCDVIVPLTEGITLLELEDNQSKITIEDKKEKRHPHHPFCKILIDFRPGHELIAIEKNKAFDDKTDKAAWILKSGLDHLLAQGRLKVGMVALYRNNNEFWPVIWDIKKTFKARVTQIRIDFKGGNHRKTETDNGLMALISSLCSKGKCDALFELKTPDKQHEINLEELNEDLTNIAGFCLASGRFDLSVYFAHFGCYRYGSELRAQFGIDDEIIETFGKIQVPDLENGAYKYELVEWLDKMSELLDSYTNERTIHEGRKRGPKH